MNELSLGNFSKQTVIQLKNGFTLTVDKEADAAYFTCKNEIGQLFTHEHSSTILVDFDYDGSLAGIEILNLKTIIPAKLFASQGSELYEGLTEANMELANLNSTLS